MSASSIPHPSDPHDPPDRFTRRQLFPLLGVAAAAAALAPAALASAQATSPTSAAELQPSQSGTLAGNSGGAFHYFQIAHPTGAAVTLTLSYSPFDVTVAHGIGFNVYQNGSQIAAATGQSLPLGDSTNSSSPSATFTPSASAGSVLIQVFNYSTETINYTLTSSLTPVALGPSAAQARFVYVGTYTAPNTAPGGLAPSTAVGIYVFKLDPSNGALTPVQVVPNIPNPSFVVLDPQMRFLYATNEVSTWKGQQNSGGVTAFAVDPTTGMLTLLNDQPSMGAIPAQPTVDPTGRFVVVSNYVGANFTILPIQSDGRLGPASDVFKVTGMGPNQSRQEAPHPHDVKFDPAGGFFFGPDLGTDKVWAWRLDSTAGKFISAALPYVQVASGSGPRHMAFHPSGKWAYVIDEMVSSITAFSYDGTRGAMTWIQTVSTLPSDFTGSSTTAEIIVHPSGKFVYGSNRGHDSIVGFAIDPTSGKLSLIGWTSTQGKVPRGFNIDPSGSLLLAGNQNSDSIVAFRIDPTTGTLVPTGAVTQTPTPVSIAFGRVVGA